MAIRQWLMPILALTLSPSPATATPPTPGSTITVSEARTLPTPQLARELLGERLGSRVIEAVRHEYESSGSTPRYVDFYTQPEQPWPRINGVCRTDVITIEYNWFDFDAVDPSTPRKIVHVEATSRYLAFPMPPGEPGSPENERAQEAACANFDTALEAFRAPSAGDAQWLAAIAEEYSRSPSRNRRFNFTCRDLADPSCAQAASALPALSLRLASDVRLTDCPPERTRDQVRYCYRLTFPYAETDAPEWVLSVVAGMRDGMAPVEIRSLTLEHVQRSIAFH
jgi:hypothetical protein